ncbi:MAG: hypothetical protein LBQ47_04545 [Endomicrobium sp.]|jgi:hypothetical protein|nr:hypothetical protein [Endomicrobium sp.]
MKKIIVSLLVLFLLMPGFALSEAGASAFFEETFCGQNSAGLHKVIDNKIMFVKDYCQIAAQIRAGFKNSFTVLSFSAGGGDSLLKNEKQFFSYNPAVYNSSSYKKLFTLLPAGNYLFSGSSAQHHLLFLLFLTFIVSAMLLYIGLLRLFNAESSVKIKKLIIMKTGFAC